MEFLKAWLGAPGRLQPSVANKAREWLTGQGDRRSSDWDISRDAPYFGIPDARRARQVFLRVARRADRLSRVAARTTSTAARRARTASRAASRSSSPRRDVEQIHFIGKDIIYFHTLFWPAMLQFAGRKVPDNVYVHGFITVSGAKMSKSRGTGISPLRYLEIGMNPEWLRYYIAAKLNANVEDIDFNPDDFIARVNSDLVGKYVNIASRAARLHHEAFRRQGAAPRAAARRRDVALERARRRGRRHVIAAHYDDT